MIELPIAFVVGFVSGWLYRGLGSERPRPARLVRRDYVSPAAVLPEATASQWNLYATAFAFHGNQLRFSERRMMQAGVCTSPAYRKYKELLRDAGVIVTVERRGTQWSPGWGYPRFRSEVRNGSLSLPLPTGQPPALNTRGWAPQITHRTAVNAG